MELPDVNLPLTVNPVLIGNSGSINGTTVSNIIFRVDNTSVPPKLNALPVLVFDSSDNYRKIRDHENNTGWIHVSQLSKKKAVLILSNQVIMFKSSTIFSKPLVALEKGRLCLILKCNDDWCKIKSDKYSGWVKKENLWGNF